MGEGKKRGRMKTEGEENSNNEGMNDRPRSGYRRRPQRSELAKSEPPQAAGDLASSAELGGMRAK